MSRFGSAFQKVERANEHIHELQTLFNGHRESHMIALRSELVADGSTLLQVDFSPAVPPDIPLLMGDAIHNLRSALDHATWELLRLDGNREDDKTAFPCSKGTADDYERKCNEMKTLCSDTKKFFIGFGAHPNGKGEDLFRLHELNNIDKHRKLMATVHIASIDNLKITDPSGRVRRLDSIQFHNGVNTIKLMQNKGDRLVIEADQDTTTAFDIFFDEGDFFRHFPIPETLLYLSSRVDACLWQFRNFVSQQRDAYPSSDVGEW